MILIIIGQIGHRSGRRPLAPLPISDTDDEESLIPDQSNLLCPVAWEMVAGRTVRSSSAAQQSSRSPEQQAKCVRFRPDCELPASYSHLQSPQDRNGNLSVIPLRHSDSTRPWFPPFPVCFPYRPGSRPSGRRPRKTMTTATAANLVTTRLCI
jgi:hypothetical protein